MNRALPAVMVLLTLAACATATGGTSQAPQKNTTLITVPVSNGSQVGSVNYSVSSIDANAPVVSTLAAGREVVYAVLDSAYAALGIEVAMRDPASWSLGNRNLQISRRLNGKPLSTYFNCGNSAMGASVSDSYRLQISVISSVAAQGTGSRLETTAQAAARAQGPSSPPVACTSTGELEKAIGNHVALSVGG
ncbi:MAG TPA: hypothetical protein VF092_08965 [Longimicrobium sp.]